MYRFFISICFLFFVVDGFSQEQKKDTLNNQLDSISYKTSYGLRVGLDISKPIMSQFNSTYKGLELVSDYRISKNFYIATEFGFEEETSNEDYSNSTSKGNYLRVGFNYNAYKNWLDMNNEIFVGYRYGLSFFDQTLNSYSHNLVTGDSNIPIYFPSNPITTPVTASNLNAHWSEIVVGIKAEIFNNFFASFSGSYKVLMSVKDPSNFKTLYAPGFNRIFDSNSGFGFNYTLTYLIPFSKK